MSLHHKASVIALAAVLLAAPSAFAQYAESGRDWNSGWDDAGMAKFSRTGPGRMVGKDYSHMVEWWGLNLGGGYIKDSLSFGKIDMHLFTISRKNWYYTIIDAGIFPFLGGAGIGGRAGYQKFFGSSTAIRIGGKFGFAFWYWNAEDEDDSCAIYGVEIAPHIQIVKFYRHASLGFGIDFPVYIRAFTEDRDSWYSGSREDPPIAGGGVTLYFRLGVY
ncbi:MAG TPA: hypothetical protein PKG82_03600 [Myxococcota bacterium]|nr:hypothetical protein [Myxococcota bacterium]